MKIGLFGGSFDPVHIGHRAIAEAAIDFGLDRVIIIPTGKKIYYKASNSAPCEDRLAMLRLAFPEDVFEISDYETKIGGICYSADTVEHFKEAYPKDALYFIIGEDSYDYFYEWREPERILKNSTLLVYPRGEGGGEIKPPAVRLDCEKVNAASSDIREKIKRGENIEGQVTKKVLEYIEEKKLYR